MRLSSQAIHMNAVKVMLQQQQALAKIQTQVATGKRVNTPADDPIAAVHILELERAQLESAQYAKNSALARSRLNLEEQALADIGTVLQRVRELVVQASNTGTMNDADRRSIAVELESRLEELQDIGNRRDGGGEYLFSGFSTLTRPFAGAASGTVSYAGDQGSRQLQVGPTQRVSDGHSGFDVFMNIPGGNGTFVTAVAPGNSGSGRIDVGTITDISAWVPDDYTLTFDATGQWEITDGATPPNVVAAGLYTSGAPIEFNGIQITITGEPADGDTFFIERSRPEDVFTTVSRVARALSQPASDPAAMAQLASTLERSLQQLDQAEDHMLGVRAQVGARLHALDSADAARENLDIDIANSLSELRYVDYAQAVAQLNQRLVGLQAAQLSYSQISQLSLFNYLR